MNNKFYYKWMAIVAAGLMVVHYLIFWITKTDESFFFLIAIAILALAVTTWIFDFFERRKK